MTIFRTVIVLLLLLAAGTAAAQEATQARVTPLMTEALADYPGKEVLMIAVDYPPGAVIGTMHTASSMCWRVRS
jgi:hypothetical protein